MPDEQKTTTAATPTDMIGGVKPEPPIPSEPLTPAISMPPTPAGGAGAPGVTEESAGAALQTPSAQPAPAPGSFGAGSPAGAETTAASTGAPIPASPDTAVLEAALPVQTPRTGRRPMALLIVVVLVAVVAIGAAMAVSAMNKH
jgi:hypothetical protein